MAWGRRCQQPPREAAPVVGKTPEQLAAERAARMDYWKLMNPVRVYRITYLDGAVKDVVAHSSSVTDGRVAFWRLKYTEVEPLYVRAPRDMVYWAFSENIRSVEMVEE